MTYATQITESTQLRECTRTEALAALRSGVEPPRMNPQYDYGQKPDGSWIEQYDLERAAERYGYEGWSHVVDVCQPDADKILAELRGEAVS